MRETNPKIIFIDSNGDLDPENEFAVEHDSMNAAALADCPFAIGDKVKLTSACPKATRKSCSVRIGDVGTMLGVSAWPINEDIIVQADVRWDHEEADDPVFLGIFVEHLEMVAPNPETITDRRGAIRAQKERREHG